MSSEPFVPAVRGAARPPQARRPPPSPRPSPRLSRGARGPVSERRLRLVERWDTSSVAEWATALTLQSLPDTWVVRHDVAWPGRPESRIDHLVVGPGGVFVVDTRAWTGPVHLDRDGLSHQGRSCADEVARVDRAARAVAAWLGLPATAVRAVLCLVWSPGADGDVDGVTVCPRARLLEVLRSSGAALSPREVDALAARPTLGPSGSSG